MSVCEIRIPLGIQHWRESDDRIEFRKLTRFVSPLYWPDLKTPELIRRYERNMEFFFTTYRVGERAAVIKICIHSSYGGNLVNVEIGGCVGDFVRVDDKIDALIGFQNSEYVSVEFSHGMRNVTSPTEDKPPIIVHSVGSWADYRNGAREIGEALHNARAFLTTLAGDDRPMNACIAQIERAMKHLPPDTRPK